MQNKIQQSFNRAANTYDDSAHAQKHAGFHLASLLKASQRHANHLLDIGCGTGFMTEHVASQYQYHSFHAIDIASALLNKAKVQTQSSIQFYQMDFDALSDTSSHYDVIYSNMALQWSRDLPALLNTIYKLLQRNGTLSFSLPLTGTFTELQSHCALNSFFDMQIVKDYLANCGYEVIIHETETLTFVYPDTIRALQSIKQIGANHVHHRINKGLTTRSRFLQFDIHQLTYVIGYFVARKK